MKKNKSKSKSRKDSKSSKSSINDNSSLKNNITKTSKINNKSNENSTRLYVKPNILQKNKNIDQSQKIINIINNEFYERDKEREKIEDFLESTKKIIYICGQPGTGKTSLVMNIINKKQSLDNNKYIIVNLNCYSIKGIKEIYDFYFIALKSYLESNNEALLLKIIETDIMQLESVKPLSNKEILIKSLGLLKNIAIPVLILDEVDGVYPGDKSKCHTAYNELFKIPFTTDNMIKIIMISNNSEFDKKIFNEINLISVNVVKVIFSPYTKNDAVEIIKKLLTHNDLIHYFEPIALKFLCEKSVSNNGDIRKAINNTQHVLLTYFQEKKEGLVSNDKITLTYVNDKLKLIGTEVLNALKSLTTEQRYVLLSIYRLMKEDDEKNEFNENKIYEEYKTVKTTKFSCDNVSVRLFDESLKALKENGILDSKESKKKVANFKMNRFTFADMTIIFENDLIFKIDNES